MKWDVFQYDEGAVVLPRDDRKKHTFNDDCWCEPDTVESLDKPIYIHRPFDSREFDNDDWLEIIDSLDD